MTDKLTRIAIIFTSAMLMALVLVLPVFADGQYGQYGAGSETPSEQPKEEVVHEETHDTVDADLGDNLFLIGLGTASMGILLAILSRLTRGVTVWD
jgi:hypothetical protein